MNRYGTRTTKLHASLIAFNDHLEQEGLHALLNGQTGGPDPTYDLFIMPDPNYSSEYDFIMNGQSGDTIKAFLTNLTPSEFDGELIAARQYIDRVVSSLQVTSAEFRTHLKRHRAHKLNK